jgi:hypothetical protein
MARHLLWRLLSAGDEGAVNDPFQTGSVPGVLDRYKPQTTTHWAKRRRAQASPM